MAERIRFYMDEQVACAITDGLRLRGVDVLTAQDGDMLQEDDERHLALAQREGRVQFT